MNPAQHQRLLEIFLEVCDLPPGHRTSRILQRCAGDVDLRRRIELLLAHDQSPIADLTGLSDGIGAHRLASDLSMFGSDQHAREVTPDPPCPDHIAHYRILRKIGEGGMGIVYEAQQDEPARRVALKVIRPGLVSRNLFGRFRHEAQILARLHHPGIAHIYEANMADRGEGGQPYFAMELISGAPLLTFVRQRGLSIRQRLALIARVCDALQHAHTNGVIHRDLKPANILIESQVETPPDIRASDAAQLESVGQPKILDFGVARVTDSDLQTITMQTSGGQLIGTLAYMSPEQACGDPGQIDTRSDIYSLGVITFELLTGRLPYDLSNRLIPEIARVIRDEEPSRLSSADRTLRGDIETIVAKALEKDKNRRYQSAAELASDIRRYLHDQPVMARPPSTMYQLRKFARRNRVLVGGVVVSFVLLIAGIITTSWQARLAHEAHRESQIEHRRAQAINTFLIEDVLKGVQNSPDGHNAKLVDVLLAAIPQIEPRFVDVPLTRARVSLPLSETLRILGRFDESLNLARSAYELTLAKLGPDDPETLATQRQFCSALNGARAHAEAERMSRDLVERSSRLHGSASSDSVHARALLGNALQAQSKFAEAEPLLRDLADVQRKHPDIYHDELPLTLNGLAACLYAQRKHEEALPVRIESVDVARRHYGNEHEATLAELCGLAQVYNSLQRIADAEPICREALQIGARIFPPDHPGIGFLESTYADCLCRMQKYSDAEPLALSAYARMEKAFGLDRYDTERANNLVCRVYREWHKPQKLEPAMRRAVELRRRVEKSTEHKSVLSAMEKHAAVLIELDRHIEAIEILRTAAEIASRTLSPDDDLRKLLDEKTSLAMRPPGSQTP